MEEKYNEVWELFAAQSNFVLKQHRERCYFSREQRAKKK
jgi:hypothetical protein